MKATLTYKFADNSEIILKEKTGTFIGKLANDVLMIFIHKQINDYEGRKEILDYAVTEKRAILL